MTESAGSMETPRERVMPVIDRLKGISHEQVKDLLDREQADRKAGIAHAQLDGKLETGDGEYHFHAARVFSGKEGEDDSQAYVNPHYHTVGEEPYVILKSTSGEMNTGRVVDGSVVWDSPRPVSAGETIIVEEGQVHSLRNTGEEPLDFVFACPDSHLIDPPADNADRFFTKDLPNGIPPHYPK